MLRLEACPGPHPRGASLATMTNPLLAFWMRPRLLAAAVLVLVLSTVLPFESIWTRLMAGWCLGVAAYIALVVRLTVRQSTEDLRREASRLDDSALVVSLFALLAAAASCVAVAMLVFDQQDHGAYRIPHIALAVLTLVAAWAFVQVVFAIHYAHLYYGADEAGHSRGGLDFNGDPEPDFWDFVYFSVTIGATSQTSDTDITAKTMRRVATVQTVYAYFFNTSVLALAVNMAAGFVQR
ncbi:hypothetical protein GMJLKIPL_3616 [Methylobacterium isbiliense]|uniref:DUF1345 domain-containing protein n=2 Tax=Methylobacterium isbiliense TaxID=315478 RepID=A0ABQ4SF15_9HYPH|nr:hypothetical protein GMJLKIPL_3616 [Methylobacterium isbiliense]